jgi:hypothetical protein
MLHDPVADLYWERLFTEFPEFQIVVCDAEASGWDAFLEQGFVERQRKIRPTVLSTLLTIVAREHQG